MPEARRKGETEKDFIGRCMSEIKGEYPDEKQRYAVCKSYADKFEKDMKQEELFVLQPRKSENRGTYLARCSNNGRMRKQFKNIKERMGFCLNTFNEYYSYWSKLEEFGEIPTDSILGECIAQEKSKGFDYKTAYRHCASKVVSKSGPINLEEDLLVEPVEFADISVDFDDTLSTERGQNLVRNLIDDGNTIHIITRRNENENKDVYKIADELGISRADIHFTNGKLKWETIKQLGIEKHIDNNEDEIKAIKENLPNVQTVKFGLEEACWEGYEAIGLKVEGGQLVPNCVPIKE